MKVYWLKAKDWWLSLALREKQAVSAAGFVLIIFILYAGIWLPLHGGVATMRQRIVSEQKTLVWMQTADKELQKSVGQKAEQTKATTPMALLSLMQKQINQAGLESYLTQLKQASNESIEAHFQKVEFDKLVGLLRKVMKEQGVTVTQVSVVGDGAPGLVNVDVMIGLG